VGLRFKQANSETEKKDNLKGKLMAIEPLKSLYIFADIETDSLQVNKILQIAAIAETGEQFNIHLNPKAELPLSCTNITGLYFHKGNLYKNGRQVPSVSIQKGLRDFRKWILNFPNSVHLVFHNAFSFDIRIIVKQFLKFNIKFPENILEIHDTLPSFRKKIKENEIKDHRLATLAEHTKVELNNAHDALADSIALKEICISFTKSQNLDLHEFLNLYKKPTEHFFKLEQERIKKNGEKR